MSLPLITLHTKKATLIRFSFVDDAGNEIIAIEDRGDYVFALVADVRRRTSVKLIAPVRGTHGFARAEYNNKTGICRDTGGAEATRRVIAAVHNRHIDQVSEFGEFGKYLFLTIEMS